MGRVGPTRWISSYHDSSSRVRGRVRASIVIAQVESSMFEFGVVPFGVAITVAVVVIAFVSGVGITAIGPGGIFLTIALYTLTALPSNTIAGTVHVAFVATGVVGSIAYWRSGELSTESLVLTSLICGGGVGGALVGAWINGFVSHRQFGFLLGLLTGVMGLVTVYRERWALTPKWLIDVSTTCGQLSYFTLGFMLGALSGLLGVGGPVLAVPALVLIGVPILQALAVSQVQSTFIAASATLGYSVQGAVSVGLALLIGAPLVAGVLLGWLVAHRVDSARLKVMLGIVLVVISPLMLF